MGEKASGLGTNERISTLLHLLHHSSQSNAAVCTREYTFVSRLIELKSAGSSFPNSLPPTLPSKTSASNPPVTGSYVGTRRRLYINLLPENPSSRRHRFLLNLPRLLLKSHHFLRFYHHYYRRAPQSPSPNPPNPSSIHRSLHIPTPTLHANPCPFPSSQPPGPPSLRRQP